MPMAHELGNEKKVIYLKRPPNPIVISNISVVASFDLSSPTYDIGIKPRYMIENYDKSEKDIKN